VDDGLPKQPASARVASGKAMHAKSETPETAAPELWRLPCVIAKTGCGRTTIYDGIRAGTFPQPVPLGGRSVAWSSHEIENWIVSRIAARDAQRGAA